MQPQTHAGIHRKRSKQISPVCRSFMVETRGVAALTTMTTLPRGMKSGWGRADGEFSSPTLRIQRKNSAAIPAACFLYMGLFSHFLFLAPQPDPSGPPGIPAHPQTKTAGSFDPAAPNSSSLNQASACVRSARRSYRRAFGDLLFDRLLQQQRLL